MKSLVDKSSRAFVHLAGRPTNDPTYEHALHKAEDAIIDASKELSFGPKQLSDRRGAFPTFAYGISYGGGQTVRGVTRHQPVTDTLLAAWESLAFQAQSRGPPTAAC